MKSAFATALKEDLLQDTKGARSASPQERSMLVDELHHRLRNILTVIRTVARQTQANTVTDYKDQLDARLDALTSYIDMIGSRSRKSVRLIDLIELALASNSTVKKDQIVLFGPDITVDPALCLPFSRVFGELAANANKYGALTSTTGMVRIRWHLVTLPDLSPALAIAWSEHNGSWVCGPRRRGFRRRLLDQAFGSNGKVEVRVRCDGLDCFMVTILDRTSEDRSGYVDVGEDTEFAPTGEHQSHAFAENKLAGASHV